MIEAFTSQFPSTLRFTRNSLKLRRGQKLTRRLPSHLPGQIDDLIRAAQHTVPIARDEVGQGARGGESPARWVSTTDRPRRLETPSLVD
jgi:hypothetical protein